MEIQVNRMPADSQTAERLRSEFKTVHDALSADSAPEVQDPLGQDGTVQVVTRSFRNTGGGEMVFLKTGDDGAKRWTRFRSWGPSGTDFIEKSSYLLSGGKGEFHKRKLEAGDNVTVFDAPDSEDQGWVGGLS
jgi:hypothetical protein